VTTPALSFVSPTPAPSRRPRGATSVSVRGVNPPQLAELFRRYAPYVATIGYKLLGSDGELDDLVQDVFIEAHRGLHQLRSGDAARGWLARIAVRRAVRRLRRRRLRAFFSLDSVAEDAALIDGAASPEEQAQVASTYRLLEALPVAHRTAWVLHHMEGETLDSIAVLCGCSKTTVQRRVRAAQQALGAGRRHA